MKISKSYRVESELIKGAIAPLRLLTYHLTDTAGPAILKAWKDQGEPDGIFECVIKFIPCSRSERG